MEALVEQKEELKKQSTLGNTVDLWRIEWVA